MANACVCRRRNPSAGESQQPLCRCRANRPPLSLSRLTPWPRLVQAEAIHSRVRARSPLAANRYWRRRHWLSGACRCRIADRSGVGGPSVFRHRRRDRSRAQDASDEHAIWPIQIGKTTACADEKRSREAQASLGLGARGDHKNGLHKGDRNAIAAKPRVWAAAISLDLILTDDEPTFDM